MRIESPNLEPPNLHEALRQFARRTTALCQLESHGAISSHRCLTELADLWTSFRQATIELGVAEWIIDEYDHH